MIKRSLLALAMFAVAGAPALAESDKDSVPDSERVVCKTERTTGSRLPGQRICKTKAEWDRDKAEARRRADEMFEDRSSRVNTGG